MGYGRFKPRILWLTLHVMCRNLTRILGIQLLTGEAIPLLLLFRNIKTPEEVQKVSLACFVRAALSTVIGVLNSVKGGWLQANWADAIISLLFAALYGWFVACGPRPGHRVRCKVE
jgi:hypothetical protein